MVASRPLQVVLGLLLVATALAGCAEEVSPEEVDDFEFEEDLEATSTTGIIRCVVVDEAIVPISSVLVRIETLGLETTTQENGACGFEGLAPGSYFLTVSKPGYETIQTSASVEAGVPEPPVVRILMTRDASTAPYAVPYQFTGMVKCGLSYIALCGLGGEDVGDSFLAEFQLDSMPQHITMEAVWEGTQPTGDNFELRLGATPASPDTVASTATGPSPQQAVANRTLIEEYGIGGANDLVGRMFVWEMEGTNIEQHTGQCVPAATITTWCHGPGAAIDQEFELFVHAFYHYAPPEDWRFTDDPGTPQPPQ